MSEQIRVKLTTEVTATGTVEEVERFKYALECLAKDPTGIDDTLQIPAALLGVVQDYVLLLNRSDRGIYQVTLKTVEVEPVLNPLTAEMEGYQHTMTVKPPPTLDEQIGDVASQVATAAALREDELILGSNK